MLNPIRLCKTEFGAKHDDGRHQIDCDVKSCKAFHILNPPFGVEKISEMRSRSIYLSSYSEEEFIYFRNYVKFYLPLLT